eukprot:4863825-Prymnesium_polylepis.1
MREEAEQDERRADESERKERVEHEHDARAQPAMFQGRPASGPLACVSRAHIITRLRRDTGAGGSARY